jgi:hypothetical protein
MTTPALIPSGLTAETGWAHLMRWYVTGGYAADLGPYATAALVVLAAHADLATGNIVGLSVVDIAAAAGMGKTAALAAVEALRSHAWLDELPGRRPGQRARYRLRYRAGLISPDGQRAGEAAWPYIPARAGQDQAAVREFVAGGERRPGIEINVFQHVEPGGIGIVNIPPIRMGEGDE